jgi:DNA-binding NarL/FixJ family response regulator
MSLKDKLTPREVEVLKLVAEGLTANEIAEVLFISVKTVETHKSNMMEKFETNKIIKLVKIAFENNII